MISLAKMAQGKKAAKSKNCLHCATNFLRSQCKNADVHKYIHVVDKIMDIDGKD